MRTAAPVLRLQWMISHAEPRGRALAAGRTVLAVAPLLHLLANSDATLFSATPEAPVCTGVRAMSLWCLLGSVPDGLLLSRVVAIAVLVVAASGYRPRWTCVPHWYIAFSITASASISNGGDRVSHIATLLLIPICLGDERRWQWSAPVATLSPEWRGRAFAGLLVLRLQIFMIYASALVAKLADPLWRQGTAMYVVARDPNYGLPEWLLTVLEPALTWFPAVAVATWSVIGVQVVIALAILAGARFRAVVLTLGIGLHLSIALLMNLPVFGLAMIGLLTVGTVRLTGGPPQPALRANARPAYRRNRARPASSTSPSR